MKYRIYVDETGNPDLGSSENPNHRFLSLTGVIIELGYSAQTVHPQLEALKSDFFRSHPDDPVVLHRKDIVNARSAFASLREPCTRSLFDQRLLQLLRDWEYTVVTVCIDKKKHKDTYVAWRYDPYHYCLAVLIERFVLFLERCSSVGDAIAESRGGKEDRRLKESFARLWSEGSTFVSPERIQNVITTRQLKVKPKANNISGLQLADLLAHPSRNEILIEKGQLDKSLPPFAAKVVTILQSKYDRVGSRVDGVGKKFL